MELRIAHLSDVGRVREDNEDSVLTDALPLVAVADGMGGHEGGEVASKLALEQLKGWKDRLAASDEVSGLPWPPGSSSWRSRPCWASCVSRTSRR